MPSKDKPKPTVKMVFNVHVSGPVLSAVIVAVVYMGTGLVEKLKELLSWFH